MSYDRLRAKPNSGMFQNGHAGLHSEENPNWKGDSVGYTALHDWLYTQLGQPSFCEECGRSDKKKYEWANISGQYKRDISDWRRLCVSCHRRFDDLGNKAWKTRRQRGTTCEKAVEQIDMQERTVAIYPSISEATRSTKIHHGNINSVLKGKRKYAGGYKWKYQETIG